MQCWLRPVTMAPASLPKRCVRSATAAVRSHSGPDSAAVHGSSIGAGSSAVCNACMAVVPSVRRSLIPDWSEPPGLPPVASRL